MRRRRTAIRRALVSLIPSHAATWLRDRRATARRLLALDEYLNSMERSRYPGLVADDSLASFGRRLYSQNLEDGMLLHVLASATVATKRFVEFGCGNGVECNSAALAIAFGWAGLLIDGDPDNVRKAREFYGLRLGPREATRVCIVREWITADNINAIITANGFTGEVDLLSVDVDGNDYWLWEAMNVIAPRVVIVEYNATFGAQRSVSVPYRVDFDRYQAHPSGFYHGASLLALSRLGDRKGYALVGCDASGVNALFVRRDLLQGGLRAVEPGDAWRPIDQRRALSTADQFALIAHLPFETVEPASS